MGRHPRHGVQPGQRRPVLEMTADDHPVVHDGHVAPPPVKLVLMELMMRDARHLRDLHPWLRKRTLWLTVLQGDTVWSPRRESPHDPSDL